jgi:DNA invertase Pin-like site-specific DNA recombinase
MTNAIGYVRVSTEAQLEGLGLDVQRAAIEALCAERGYTLGGFYSDEGVSGSEDVAGRQGLANAIGALEDGHAAVLVIPKLDRLARDLLVQESILRDVWAAGAEVVPCVEGEQFACRPDAPDDPSRRLIRQVLGAVAEYERSMIRARMVAGRRRKIAETGYAGGPEPYGHTDKAEGLVLSDVDAWRAAGWTWNQIADELNITDRRKRNGTAWSASDIHSIMSRAWERGFPKTVTVEAMTMFES